MMGLESLSMSLLGVIGDLRSKMAGIPRQMLADDDGQAWTGGVESSIKRSFAMSRLNT